jgi:hypothetical protein
MDRYPVSRPVKQGLQTPVYLLVHGPQRPSAPRRRFAWRQCTIALAKPEDIAQ